jgi:hypothetical protein
MERVEFLVRDEGGVVVTLSSTSNRADDSVGGNGATDGPQHRFRKK